MRRIGVVGALAGVVAVVAGCWPYGPLLPRIAPDPTPVPIPHVTPAPSPWPTAVVIIVQLSDASGAPLTEAAIADAERVVRVRLAALGGPGASVRAIPDDRLRIDVADEAWADAVRDLATSPGVIGFVPVPNEYANSIVEGEPLPAGMPTEPIFGEEGIAEASSGSDQFGLPAIDIVLTPAAAQAFDDYAAAHYGERFAIVRDGLVVSAPSINATSFNGRAQISGNFEPQEAMVLVATLTGGRLPIRAQVLPVCPADSGCSVGSPEPASSPTG